MKRYRDLCPQKCGHTCGPDQSGEQVHEYHPPKMACLCNVIYEKISKMIFIAEKIA